MEKTLDDLLADFTPTKSPAKDEKLVAVWVPDAVHSDYLQLQKTSGKKLSKVIKRAVIEIVERAKQRAS